MNVLHQSLWDINTILKIISQSASIIIRLCINTQCREWSSGKLNVTIPNTILIVSSTRWKEVRFSYGSLTLCSFNHYTWSTQKTQIEPFSWNDTTLLNFFFSLTRLDTWLKWPVLSCLWHLRALSGHSQRSSLLLFPGVCFKYQPAAFLD